LAIGYRCEGCGIVRGDRWTGFCPGCHSLFNIRRTVSSEGHEEGPAPHGELVHLSDVSAASYERISTGFAGVDRILGIDPATGNCGIAARAGQATQIYGQPGSGKSSLILQICQQLTKQRYTALYVAGEESLQQVKARADRFGKFNKHMILLEEQDLDAIIDKLDEVQPTVAVIDSVQTISVEDYSQGSISSMRIGAREITKLTKANGIALFLVTQMDKSGTDFAGPKELEHIVDTSLYLSLDRKGRRILSAETKNRFGNTPAHQLFKMTEAGLVEIEEEKEPEPEPSPTSPPDLKSVP